MIPLSVLDLAPIKQGQTAADSFAETAALAKRAESLGFNRYWLAEHHAMPGIASAATSVLIGHVAEHTKSIRVGAGGIMLPNHSPLVIAEQFATLDSLHPGRIDLGLGRAPGTDQTTMRALRRQSTTNPQAFPQDVAELAAYFEGRAPIRAVPGAGHAHIPIWILGSSLFGARLAAQLGRPYAFASHFAPAMMMEALATYRREFQPSKYLDKPYAMLGYNVFAADSEEQAHYQATSWQKSFVQLRTGHPGELPPPEEGYLDSLSPVLLELLDNILGCSAIGTPEQVKQQIKDFAEQTQADELMITTNMFSAQARQRSFEIVGALIGE